MSEEEFDEDLGIKKGSMIKGKVDYVVLKVLGEGGFGSVFLVHNGEKECAMKVEKKIETRRHSKLKMEISILKTISKLRKESTEKSMEDKKHKREYHFTDIIDRGRESNFYFMVIDLVGKSLEDLQTARPGKIFGLATSLGVGIQALEAIEDLHEIQFIHRDIKPANYACGRPPNTHIVYILDFGIARKVMNKDQQLKTPREKVGFKGTVRFASLACHRNQELGMKDDVECWLYMLVGFLVKKGLPWRKENEREAVAEMKKAVRDDKTQIHKDFYGDIKSKPKFHGIMTYLESLQYVDTPDYKYIYNVLRDIGKENSVDIDAPYDWEVDTKKG